MLPAEGHSAQAPRDNRPPVGMSLFVGGGVRMPGHHAGHGRHPFSSEGHTPLHAGRSPCGLDLPARKRREAQCDRNTTVWAASTRAGALPLVEQRPRDPPLAQGRALACKAGQRPGHKAVESTVQPVSSRTGMKAARRCTVTHRHRSGAPTIVRTRHSLWSRNHNYG